MAPQLRDRWHNRGHSWRMEVRMTEIPSWHITGDWFDNCSCAVACPCTFAQAPDNGFCESVLFWHIRHGHYGDINLDGLSFVRVGRWEGDLWAGKAKGTAGIFIDDRADERQAEVLPRDRKSTRLNSSHRTISYAVFCLKKKKKIRFKHYEEKTKKKQK